MKRLGEDDIKNDSEAGADLEKSSVKLLKRPELNIDSETVQNKESTAIGSLEIEPPEENEEEEKM